MLKISHKIYFTRLFLFCVCLVCETLIENRRERSTFVYRFLQNHTLTTLKSWVRAAHALACFVDAKPMEAAQNSTSRSPPQLL